MMQLIWFCKTHELSLVTTHVHICESVLLQNLFMTNWKAIWWNDSEVKSCTTEKHSVPPNGDLVDSAAYKKK